MVFFVAQKLVSVSRSICVFVPVFLLLPWEAQETLVQCMSQGVLPVFSSGNFMSCLIFKSKGLILILRDN